MNTLKNKRSVVGTGPLYDEILYATLTCMLAPKRGLQLLRKKRSMVTDCIDVAVANEHLKEKTVRANNTKGSTARETYYIITKKGFRHLCKSGVYPWLVQSEKVKVRIFGGNAGLSEEAKRRKLCTSTIAMMSYLADCIMPPLLHESLVGNKATDGNPIDNAALCEAERKRAWFGAEWEPHFKTTYADGDIRFTDVSEAKSAATAQNEQMNDIRFARISAVLDSSFKSVICYVPTTDEVEWTERKTKIEFALARYWKKSFGFVRHSDTSPLGIDAAMFVKTPRQFSSLYKSKTNETAPRFGDGLEHCYVIPISCDGVSQLSWLMLGSDSYINKQFLNALIDSGLYIENKNNRFKTILPVTDVNGTMYAFAFHLDIIHLRSIQKAVERLDTEIGVFCFAWQEPYIHAIMPEVKIAVVE